MIIPKLFTKKYINQYEWHKKFAWVPQYLEDHNAYIWLNFYLKRNECWRIHNKLIKDEL